MRVEINVLRKFRDLDVNYSISLKKKKVYHSLAMRLKTQFITADNRHKVKSENFGHIVLLKDWQSIFKK